MIAWMAALKRRLPFSGVASVTDVETLPAWAATILQNIADMRTYLADVELEVRRHAKSAPVEKPATLTIDEEIAAADSVTRIHKALEREYGVDRRTVYARVERVAHAFKLGSVSDFKLNQRLAERDANGDLALTRAMRKLEAGR